MDGSGLWQAVHNIGNLRYAIVETAFSGREERLAVLAKHLCPWMLAEQLAQLNRSTEIFSTHLKAGEGEKIMQEVRLRAGRW